MRICAITMVHNEATMLPIWLRYYGAEFGAANLYVFDDGSTDGSTDDIDANVIRLPRLPFNDERRASLIGDFQRGLLHYFDAVIYTDADEFLVPDPAKHPSLAAYVARIEGGVRTAIGIDIIHRPRVEGAPLDWSRPILGQRRYGHFNGFMCKTLVTREPTIWGTGFHRSSPGVRLDPDLYLFHLKWCDYHHLRARQALTRSLEWDQTMLDRKLGNHQRQSDDWLDTQFSIKSRYDEATPPPLVDADLLSRAASGANKNPQGLEAVDVKVSGPLALIPERFFGVV